MSLISFSSRGSASDPPGGAEDASPDSRLPPLDAYGVSASAPRTCRPTHYFTAGDAPGSTVSTVTVIEFDT